MIPASGSIVLVDEDPKDVESVMRAFADLKVASPLLHFMDGEKALARLRQFVDKPPWFVLLSVSTSERRGMSFLKSLKSDKTLKSIPVILMAPSYHQNIVTESFRLGAAGYMLSSDEYAQLVDTLRTIFRYWTLCAWPPNQN